MGSQETEILINSFVYYVVKSQKKIEKINCDFFMIVSGQLSPRKIAPLLGLGFGLGLALELGLGAIFLGGN